MFSSYKHWHQEVLQRGITDGATDFNKADFLFHLQEIRRKATKRSTIISSWKKTGIYPFNSSAVLDRMVDPLSSLSLEAAEADLPGYISAGDSSAHPSDEDTESDEEDFDQFSRDLHHSNRVNEENRLVSSTPPLVNWNEVITPELKMRQIRQYEQYVTLRIEVSVASGTPLTPTVAHVNEKLRKAHTTLALNGITATQEMRRLKEKSLKRSNRGQGTTILANYGPITVYDARLRVAKDLHNRRANQAVEAQRMHKKEVRDEVAYLRRWMTDVRRLLRASLQQLRVNDLYSSQPTCSQGVRPFTADQFHIKTQHQDCISSAGLLGTKYCLYRELHAKMRQGCRQINQIRLGPKSDLN
ncbi:hypothetical protein FOMA001_g13664 [Fusarium oxysporum f. sp. matthiolae]|nr:hypothetical protein FOMA001_g13664 [Fusarium oxysporum f. sp. matthiolae]